MAPTTVPKLTAEQHARIIAIGKAIRATNYPNKEEQRAFLDEKVFEYVRCSFLSLLPLSDFLIFGFRRIRTWLI